MARSFAGHADAEEGVRAFLERRRPRFEDRLRAGQWTAALPGL